MLYIMRHGKTDWNIQHKLQGRTDIPLNEEGRQMAKQAREDYLNIPIDICYCSPLIRARETAYCPRRCREYAGTLGENRSIFKRNCISAAQRGKKHINRWTWCYEF